MNFTFSGGWYICIPTDILELHSGMQLSYKYISQFYPSESCFKALANRVYKLQSKTWKDKAISK